ncbi:MAG: hypothetical protein M0P58_09875 [Bacteroidales bacterium]|jgi:hypothetical protein|nr:hypothetical protein [Bacteroidales bacterium]
MKASDFKKVRNSLLFLVLLTGSHLMAAGSWKEVRSESGITIYERWVKVTSDLTVKERKGEMTIQGSMSSVVNLLSDPSKSKIWMENVSDAYLVKKESDKVWASYTYFSLPWPFENRDMVSVSHLNYEDPSSATIEMISNENALPLKKNVKRLINYKATWKITDLGNGRVFISLSTISRTSPEFPRFIQDPAVRKIFMRNMLKLKEIFCV